VCCGLRPTYLNGIGYSRGRAREKNGLWAVFLPWLEAVPVQQGNEIFVRLQANLVGEDYVCMGDEDLRGWGECRPMFSAVYVPRRELHAAVVTGIAQRTLCLPYRTKASKPLAAPRHERKDSLQQMAQAAAQRFPAIFPRGRTRCIVPRNSLHDSRGKQAAAGRSLHLICSRKDCSSPLVLYLSRGEPSDRIVSIQSTPSSAQTTK